MRTIETTVYTFDELSEAAQETALDKNRYFNVQDFTDWWDCVYGDWLEKFEGLGYRVDRKNISFTGFCSQGDGACFTGSVEKNHEQIMELLPEDLVSRIRLINSKLRLLGENTIIEDISCSFKISSNDRRYSHSNTMYIDALYPDFGEWTVCPASACTCCPEWPGLCDELEAIHQSIEEGLYTTVEADVLAEARGYADELYADLEKEHDYLTSDEAVAEALIANDYEFTEDGGRV